MRFRYIDNSGKERVIEDATALAAAIRDGTIVPDALLWDQYSDRWTPVREHDVYLAFEAASSLSGSPTRDAPAAPIETPPFAATRDAEATAEIRAEDARVAAAEAMATDAAKPHLFFTAGGHGLVYSVAAVIAYIGATSPDVSAASRVGEALGFALGGILFAGVTMFWTRRTRRYIPLLGLFITTLATIGTSSVPHGEVEASLARLEQLAKEMDGVDADLAAVAAQPRPALPRGHDARLLWLAEQVLRDYAVFVDSLLKAYGAHEEPPAWWYNERYIATASNYPEVRQYWRRYLEYVGAFNRELPVRLRSAVRTRLEEADIVGPDADDFARSAEAGFAKHHPGFVAALDSLTRSALGFHDFLAGNDRLISYDVERELAVTSNRQVELGIIRRLERLQVHAERVADLAENGMAPTIDMLAQVRARLGG